ncbi:hypothetical protein K438DRAFT_1938587 [Mycena galopus ATCC 62051]|nr:hypothetical protein K438DRAFT_1938587 [Mycena galopus ATCC 62051]
MYLGSDPMDNTLLMEQQCSRLGGTPTASPVLSAASFAARCCIERAERSVHATVVFPGSLWLASSPRMKHLPALLVSMARAMAMQDVEASSRLFASVSARWLNGRTRKHHNPLCNSLRVRLSSPPHPRRPSERPLCASAPFCAYIPLPSALGPVSGGQARRADAEAIATGEYGNEIGRDEYIVNYLGLRTPRVAQSDGGARLGGRQAHTRWGTAVHLTGGHTYYAYSVAQALLSSAER